MAEFDDARWRVLDLPHDWAIEGPFDPAISPHQGALPYFGVAWYRKRFEVPESARGRYYSLEIDGAMSNATVFLNGRELGGRPYGYIGFAVDLMRKDLGLVLDEAKHNGARLPVTALVDQFYADVQANGGRRWDTSSLITRLI